MTVFTEAKFEQDFNFPELERTILSTVRLAAQNPKTWYLFLQRYIYFNGYASSVIARLASSIAMSRYLFNDPNEPVIEQADRGFEIATKVMIAASDEGGEDVNHRALAQALLKTAGEYAKLSAEERNYFAQIPDWLDSIVKDTMAGYQGTPDNVVSLIRGMGFHAASEMLGDREFALQDTVIRHENKGTGFDRYLKEEVSPVKIGKHRYDPWCYVLIHGKHEREAKEMEHLGHALDALDMAVAYRPESQEQITEWVYEGYKEFVELQQRLFREIYRECLEMLQTAETKELASV